MEIEKLYMQPILSTALIINETDRYHLGIIVELLGIIMT